MTALLPGRAVRALLVGDESSNSPLSQALQYNADIFVVARASSPSEAVALATHASTDVVVIDLELMDGLGQDVVEGIMSSCPRPILVLSPTGHGSSVARVADALAAGAVQGVDRPVTWSAVDGAALRHAVQQVSKVHVVRHARRAPTVPVGRPAISRTRHTPVVAVAASTGGPSALAVLLAGLAGLAAPVLVVQHMHADFTGGLLTWMSRVSALPVSSAEHGQQALPGHVYFGPTGRHLLLGANGVLELAVNPVSIHRPSADQLFQSVADRTGSAGVGVVMTGMGDDGAAGLLALHRQGGRTMGQDEASCAVFGMPRAAQRAGALTDLRPLSSLADAIQRAVSEVLA